MNEIEGIAQVIPGSRQIHIIYEVHPGKRMATAEIISVSLDSLTVTSFKEETHHS